MRPAKKRRRAKKPVAPSPERQPACDRPRRAKRSPGWRAGFSPEGESDDSGAEMDCGV